MANVENDCDSTPSETKPGSPTKENSDGLKVKLHSPMANNINHENGLMEDTMTNHMDGMVNNVHDSAGETVKSEETKRSHDKHHHSSSSHSSSKSKENREHSSSSSSKHRNSSSHSHSKSSKDHHSSSSKSKDGHHSSSSSHRSKDGHHHSSASSSSRSKDTDGKQSSLSSHGDKSSSSSSRDKDKHRDSSGSHHSSSSKDKHHSSDKHKSSSSSSKDKSKDGESKHSSSSKSKDGDSDTHSSSKHRSSGDHKSSSGDHKHRSSDDKHRSSGDSKHRSSSDKHKSSSDSKHKSSGDDKHRSSSGDSKSKSDHKHRSSEEKSPVKPSPEKLKEEVSRLSDDSPERDLSMDVDEADFVKQETDVYSPRRVKSEPFSPSKVKEEQFSLDSIKEENEPMENDDMEEEEDTSLSAPKDDIEMDENLLVPKRSLSDSDDDEDNMSAKAPQVKEEVKAESPEPVVVKKEKKTKKRKLEDGEEDFVVKKKKKKKGKVSKGKVEPPPKRRKGEKADEVKPDVWEWWKEKKRDDGVKWRSLQHQGPLFAPAYERLPKDIKFYYDGEVFRLKQDAEEVATFYSKMLDHDYTTHDVFNINFFKDWRKAMTADEKAVLTDLKKCNFIEYSQYFKLKSEERKAWGKEERQALKKKNEDIVSEYGFAEIDGHKQKIGNFRIEPPGLFRGRGDHPKQGMLKKRVMPEDVIVNCGRDSAWPKAPEGHHWKEVRHDNAVTWLVCWTENVQGQQKYVMLNPASRLKGEKDWQKYETARKLHTCVDRIRAQYHIDFKSKEMRIRQRSIALYFIDKLALRAGNEKDEDQADTVGCCSLRVEHLKLHEKLGDKDCVVEFDFLGKDSIRYQNSVSVEPRVFRNLRMFTDNKQPEDDLFDRLNTTILNKHLHDLMEGLTAKVFRTYNASKTLQEQLDLLTTDDDPPAAKLLSYNRANRAVAVLCNHQRAAPKNFDQQMENMVKKVDAKKATVKDAKKDLKDAKSDYKATKSERARSMVEKKKKAIERLSDQLTKLEVQMTDKDENKEIALGTSKLNYLDPRISIAWCKKWEVPIEKIYNKTQREKFQWAVDMADETYTF